MIDESGTTISYHDCCVQGNLMQKSLDYLKKGNSYDDDDDEYYNSIH